MAKKDEAPRKPRRWTPMEARHVIGTLIVPAMLLALFAISAQLMWVLIPTGILWAAMLVILFLYWRCPRCGKTLPKMGKVLECPKCGAKID